MEQVWEGIESSGWGCVFGGIPNALGQLVCAAELEVKVQLWARPAHLETAQATGRTARVLTLTKGRQASKSHVPAAHSQQAACVCLSCPSPNSWPRLSTAQKGRRAAFWLFFMVLPHRSPCLQHVCSPISDISFRLSTRSEVYHPLLCRSLE